MRLFKSFEFQLRFIIEYRYNLESVFPLIGKLSGYIFKISIVKLKNASSVFQIQSHGNIYQMLFATVSESKS